MIRGDIWLVDLDPTVGDEIRKVRPAIIVNHDGVANLELRIIVPLTDWKAYYALDVRKARLDPNPVNGLSKVSAADTFQIRSVSTQRIKRQLGKLSDLEMQKVTLALKFSLDIP